MGINPHGCVVTVFPGLLMCVPGACRRDVSEPRGCLSEELPWCRSSAQLHCCHLAGLRHGVLPKPPHFSGGQWGCTGFTPLSKRGQRVEALVLATCLLTGSSEGDTS